MKKEETDSVVRRNNEGLERMEHVQNRTQVACSDLLFPFLRERRSKGSEEDRREGSM
jgi:hypothetical protein